MPNKIIKLGEVMELTTFSESTIYRLAAKDKFPKPIKLSERSSGWLENEVLAYLDECINNR
ncbi:AlpA family transcriptional regulator [bacterium]|jgi:prophage regulatory protein|nr:AlpA family transcriptional regulator [bacterium]